jgi:predicted transport protein
MFDKIASEILASSLKNSNSSSRIGQQLYDSFVSMLHKEFTELEETDQKLVKVFFRGKRNILSIAIQAGAIKITLNAKIGTLKDDKRLLRDVSKIGHWGNGDYQIKLVNEAHFKDVLQLIKQIY